MGAEGGAPPLLHDGRCTRKARNRVRLAGAACIVPEPDTHPAADQFSVHLSTVVGKSEVAEAPGERGLGPWIFAPGQCIPLPKLEKPVEWRPVAAVLGIGAVVDLAVIFEPAAEQVSFSKNRVGRLNRRRGRLQA